MNWSPGNLWWTVLLISQANYISVALFMHQKLIVDRYLTCNTFTGCYLRNQKLQIRKSINPPRFELRTDLPLGLCLQGLLVQVALQLLSHWLRGEALWLGQLLSLLLSSCTTITETLSQVNYLYLLLGYMSFNNSCSGRMIDLWSNIVLLCQPVFFLQKRQSKQTITWQSSFLCPHPLLLHLELLLAHVFLFRLCLKHFHLCGGLVDLSCAEMSFSVDKQTSKKRITVHLNMQFKEPTWEIAARVCSYLPPKRYLKVWYKLWT